VTEIVYFMQTLQTVANRSLTVSLSLVCHYRTWLVCLFFAYFCEKYCYL